MDIPISNLTVDDLSFRGEGEEHIVLRIRNSLNVIRLRKAVVGSSVLIQDVIELAQRDLTFLGEVARPAFGTLITDCADLVRLSPTTVKGINEKIKQKRQGLRMHKEINSHGVGCLCPDAALHFIMRTNDVSENQNGIDTDRVEVKLLKRNSIKGSRVNTVSHQSKDVIMHDKEISLLIRKDKKSGDKEISEDYISNSISDNLNASVEQEGIKNSTYPNSDLVCIEIKPKAGIMDISVPENTFCKFCIKNFLKVEKQKESSRSLYCPMDLFSGKKILMQKAIDGLFLTPQNNLNIFKNGEPIENLLDFSYLKDLCIDALLYDFSHSANNSHSEDLNINSALGITLLCQKRDLLGAFKAQALYLKLVKEIGSKEMVDERLQSTDALQHYGKQVSSFQKRYQILLDIHNKFITLNQELETAYRKIEDNNYFEKENSNSKLNKLVNSRDYISSDAINNISSNDKHNIAKMSSNLSKNKKLLVPKKSKVEISQKVNIKSKKCESKKSEVGLSQKLNLEKKEYSFEEISQDESRPPKFIPDLTELSSDELIEHLSHEDMFFLLQENLFAMTAKDLSLMVLLRGPYPGISPKCEPWKSPFYINSSCGWYECQITSVDIISKPASKIMKHNQDITKLCSILEQLRETREEPGCCKIQK